MRSRPSQSFARRPKSTSSATWAGEKRQKDPGPPTTNDMVIRSREPTPKMTYVAITAPSCVRRPQKATLHSPNLAAATLSMPMTKNVDRIRNMLSLFSSKSAPTSRVVTMVQCLLCRWYACTDTRLSYWVGSMDLPLHVTKLCVHMCQEVRNPLFC